MDVLGGLFIFVVYLLIVVSIKNVICFNCYGIFLDGWIINGESIFYKGV